MEVLKKFNHDIASVTFFIAAGVCEAALVKHVIKSDDRNHLLGMRYTFESTPESTKLDSDVHSAVVHVRYIKETCVAGQDLIVFYFGSNFPKRRFAVEINCILVFLAVDCSRIAEIIL